MAAHPTDRRGVLGSEATRRLLFGGLDALKAVSARNQQEMVDAHAHTLRPPGDSVLPQLPVGPK